MKFLKNLMLMIFLIKLKMSSEMRQIRYALIRPLFTKKSIGFLKIKQRITITGDEPFHKITIIKLEIKMFTQIENMFRNRVLLREIASDTLWTFRLSQC